MLSKVAELPIEIFTIALSEDFVAGSASWFLSRHAIEFFFAIVERTMTLVANSAMIVYIVINAASTKCAKPN